MPCEVMALTLKLQALYRLKRGSVSKKIKKYYLGPKRLVCQWRRLGSSLSSLPSMALPIAYFVDYKLYMQ